MNGLEISIFSPRDYLISEWSGGSTTQLAICPLLADYAKRNFQWRLSSATVEADRSRFTPLPGVRRFLMPLDGSVELHHGGQAALRLEPYEVDVFDGGVDTESVGRCRDFNLMTRAGCEGALRSFCCGPETVEVTLGVSDTRPVTEAFYAADGEVTARLDGRTYALLQGGLFLLRICEKADAAVAGFCAAQPVHIVRAIIRENG